MTKTRDSRAARVASALLALLLAGVAAPAQDVTGTISGTVVDETSQVLPGATVTLISEQTRTSRAATADDKGDFRFLSVPPGPYTIKVELSGFRTLERRNNILSASERLSLGSLRLAVGGHSEILLVEASGTKVNPEDSQHSGLLTSNQIAQIQTKGRDVTNLLRLLPGVRYREDVNAMGEDFGTLMPNIGGQREAWNHITVDGVIANEVGGAGRMAQQINLDAIEEVKVLLNNYRAEYGRGGGAYVQIVSKGGGAAYAGNLYYYGRHESLNANDFFENKRGAPRPRYRFNTMGANFGGPLQIPGLLEQKGDKKLFFFYSLEAPLNKRPGTARDFRLPTAAERSGDFSQSGIRIYDPLTGREFPNAVIPRERLDPNGRLVLGMFPLPNGQSLRKDNANHGFRDEVDNPRLNQVLRVDWKPSAADTFYVTAKDWYSDQRGSDITVGPSRWGWIDTHYKLTDRTLAVGHTRIFGGSLINEANLGIRRQTEQFFPVGEEDWKKLRRASVGFTVGQFHPELNPQGIIPKFLFGADVGAAATAGAAPREPGIWFDNRLVDQGYAWAHSLRDNLSWTRGGHVLKAGLYVEHLFNNEGKSGSWMGEYDFRSRSDNPLDACKGAPGTANPTAGTACAFANAALGVFREYRESDNYQNLRGHGWLAEWYLQDTWKATRRLTIDYGMRFHWATPWYDSSNGIAAFVPARYDPARAPRLYYPHRTAAGEVVAIDRATGEIRPRPFIGAFVPGSGDIYNGSVRSGDPDYPRGFRDNPGIHPEPRLGVAYDVFGNGRTALHASAGLYHYGRVGVGIINDLTSNPPVVNNPIVRSGTFDSLLSLAGIARPSNTRAVQRDAKTPSVYSWALGVQHELGWGSVIDLTYTGSVNRHLGQRVYINRVPDGAKFVDLHPENVDPTTGRVLDEVFLRPITMYGQISELRNFGTQNYNALQVQINRRYIKGLQFSVAYTFSKSLGISDNDDGTILPERGIRSFYYSPAGHNQTHNLVFNYTWDLPRASRLWDNAAVRALFDGWQISGENAIVSGDFDIVTLRRINGADAEQYFGAGSEAGRDAMYRPRMTGKPELPRGQRRSGVRAEDGDGRWFNVNAFAGPAGRFDYGNTPRTVFREPGIDNWNLSLFKNFPLGGRRRLQLRWEIYNVLNHTQFDEVNGDFEYNTTSGLQTNPLFGQVTSARPPRIMQGSLRLTF